MKPAVHRGRDGRDAFINGRANSRRVMKGRAAAALSVGLLALLPPLFAVSPPGAAAGVEGSPLELMIAPDSFVVELLPLKEWREQQGVRVDIVTTTYLQSQVPARDLPESIKGCIDQRRAADPTLRYVLLAADDPIIPGRLLQVSNRSAGATTQDLDRATVSDYYYAVPGESFLDAGDLGDDYPGGPPWYGISDSSWSLTPSISVGRIPASTASELSAFVTRLLAWEQAPPSGVWQSRAVLGLAVASVPDSTFSSRRLGDDAGVAFASVEAQVAASGLTNISLRDYPEWPAPYDTQVDRLDAATFLGEWNLGAFLVVLAGRDSPLAGGPGEGYSGDGTSPVFSPVAAAGGLEALSNGGKLPLFVAAYGGSANFSRDNNSNVERALTSPSGGAALAVGFTGRSSAGADPGGPVGGWTLAAAVVGEVLARPGPAGVVLDAARARFVDGARAALGGAFDINNASLRRAFAGLTLLGDPASPFRPGPLKSLDIVLPPGIPPNAPASLAVRALHAGLPVANATVAVIDDLGELQAVGVTDAQGLGSLQFTTGGPSGWTVHVSAAGYATASAALPIDSPPTVAVITPGPSSKVGGRLNFSGVAGDPDPGDSVVAVEAALDGAPWAAAVGTTSWSFEVDTTALTNGAHSFAARASDGVIWSLPKSVEFNVTNAKPPVLTAGYGDLTLVEDNTTVFPLDLPLHFASSGPDAFLSASASTQDRIVVSVVGNGLRVVPGRDFFGSAVLTLRVFDSYGGDFALNITVRVLPVDDAPQLSVASNFTVEEGGTVNFDPRATDPDGTGPTVYLESGPANATATGWTPPRGASGEYTLVIAASDGRYIARASLVVTVVSHNSPPSGRLVAPDVGEAGREIALEAQDVADKDGDAVTAAWDFGDGQGARGLQTSHVYAAPGLYTVTVTLSDGRGSTTLTRAVSVDPYRPLLGPSDAIASAIGYASIAVILVCAAAATYLLFVTPLRRGVAQVRPAPMRDPEEE